MARTIDARCVGVLDVVASVAEDPVRNPVKPFLLRLLFLYPLSIAAWWALGGLQVDLFAAISSLALNVLLPSVHVITQSIGDSVQFQVQGHSTVGMDPLVLTRGLPIYLALMFAAPAIRDKWQGCLIGTLLILTVAILGLSCEASVRISEQITSHSSSIAPAELVQIIAKSVATRVLPIGLWLWQQWRFVRSSLAMSD